MEPAKPAQLLVAKGLDTETQSIGAGGAKLFQLRRRSGLRISLDGDLRAGQKRERLAARIDDAMQLGRLQQGRGAAAEEDRVSFDRRIGVRADVGDQRI